MVKFEDKKKWKDQMPTVRYITASEADVRDWFRRVVGKEHTFWYESAATNFFVEHADRVINGIERVLIEFNLGHTESKGTLKPDVIFVCKDDLWIVEVKYPVSQKEVFDGGEIEGWGAEQQLKKYYRRLKKLGWWESKIPMVAIFWVYYDKIMKNKKIALDNRLLK